MTTTQPDQSTPTDHSAPSDHSVPSGRTGSGDGAGSARTNWSGNVTYRAAELLRPTSLEQVRAAVVAHPRVTALGSRHSFSRIADTDGAQLTVADLPATVEVDRDRGVARVAAGMTYAAVAAELDRWGLALANLASLPHISVAGATATGTHGSGARNASLASSVVGMQIVRADGSVDEIGADHPDLDAHRVGLGALGIVTAVDLAVEPRYDVAQRIHLGLSWEAAEEHFAEIMGAGYSASMFTGYQDDGIRQVWTKRRTDRDEPHVDLEALGATAATETVHPVPGQDFQAVTEQLGVPGTWHERLPHFRSTFTPSAGEEIQCEYLLAVGDAVPAMRALREIGNDFEPVLMVSEIRCVAADSAWMAPSAGRDSVAFHFTFHRDEDGVAALLPRIDAALAPFGGRPHLGKVAAITREQMLERYPAIPAFVELARRVDPDGRFWNPALEALLG